MKKYRILMFSAVLLYVTYMAAKNIYTSEIIEIMRHFGVTKSDASAASSFSFVTYAAAQLVFVKIIRKLNVRRYLLICSPVSVLLFAAVPFCTDIRQIWMIFAVLGALLAGVFPVCMLVISEYLPDELVPAANAYNGAAFALSFSLDYFFSALFIKIADWRLGFWVFPALYMISVILFCLAFSACERRKTEKAQSAVPGGKKAAFKYLFFAGSVGFLVNLIYYAVSGWVPNLLSEQFGLTPALSVLVTLLIPLTGAAGCVVCLRLCNKHKNAATVISAASAVLSAVLAFVYGSAFPLTLGLVTVLLFIVRGMAHVFGWQVPVNARRFMDPSSAATAINIFGCIGAAAGPVIFGAIADANGYAPFFIAAAAAAVLMTAAAAAGADAIA